MQEAPITDTTTTTTTTPTTTASRTNTAISTPSTSATASSPTTKASQPAWSATRALPGAGDRVALYADYGGKRKGQDSGGQYLDIDMLMAGDSDTDYSSDDEEEEEDAGAAGGARARWGRAADVGSGGGAAGAGVGATASSSSSSSSSAPATPWTSTAGALSADDIAYLRRSGVDVSALVPSSGGTPANGTTSAAAAASAAKGRPKASFALGADVTRLGKTLDATLKDGDTGGSAEPEFYDEHMDDKADRWMRKHHNDPKASSAVLNCPFCFSPVCYQCTRHVKFKTQYFATKVVNCVVDSAEQLVFDAKTRRKKPARKATNAAASGTPGVAPAGQEVYAPLRCRTCNTEVGVQDEDGAYHLFHVIPAEEH